MPQRPTRGALASARPVLTRCSLSALLVAAIASAALAQTAPRPPQGPAAAPDDAPAEGLLHEPAIIGRGVDRAVRTLGDGSGENTGFYPEFSNMITGAGWISAGPGYRRRVFGDRAIADVSAALSWRAYKMAQARLEAPALANGRVTVGTQLRWQDLTQITFFGTGADTSASDRSEYRLTSTNLIGYAAVRPVPWLSLGGTIGWLSSPDLDTPAGTFKRGNPATQVVFPDDPVFAFADQPGFVHGDVSATADTRDHRSHPTSGGLYRIAWSRYADRDAGLFSFSRFEAEGAQFVPTMSGRLVFAVRGWLAASSTDEGGVVPFYLQPSLGGANTVRGYDDYRFHDRNSLVVNAEARLALTTHVDGALFVDAGNVAAKVGDLDLDKRGYGFGLRLHSARATFVRLDIARAGEGWAVILRMNDPLHLARLSRRTADLPFVP